MSTIKKFSKFISEEIPPPMASAPPTNTAGDGGIAGLPPDMPPGNPRLKSNIARRKKMKPK